MHLPSLYNPYVQPCETRVLGLDVGLRRIGVAVSDPLGMTAQGLDTLHRKNKKYDFAYLHRVIRQMASKKSWLVCPCA